MKAISDEGDVRHAACALQITPSTIYSVLTKIRVKQIKSQNTVNVLNVARKKSLALRRLLIPLQKVPIPEAEAEETEEETEAEEKYLMTTDLP